MSGKRELNVQEQKIVKLGDATCFSQVLKKAIL